jgi:hypothetical protein
MMISLLSLAVLVLDVLAVISLLQSGADTGTKVLWIVLIVLLPFFGMLLYFLVGPGRGKLA